MGQRNMRFSNYMVDLETDQQNQGHFQPDPGFGGMMSYPQPGVHGLLPAQGNSAGFDFHHLPEHRDGGAFYHGMMQYKGVQHHHHPTVNLDLGVATASNYCNPYLTPSGIRVFPVPMSHVAHDQLPSSSNHGIRVGSASDYDGNNHCMDGFRYSFKGKNTELIPGTPQYFNASASSSSSVTRPHDSGITLVNPASFPPTENRENDIPSTVEGRPHRSARNRSGSIGLAPVLAHAPNHFQGNYLNQPFQMVANPWLDQHFSSNVGDGSTSAWNGTLALNYGQGSNVNGMCIETENIAMQANRSAGNRTANNMHLPQSHQGHHNLHHAPPPPPPLMQGPHFGMNPFQDCVEIGRGFVGPVPPTGFRIQRPQQRGVMLNMIPGHHSLPQLRFLPRDEVAILDMSSYYEVGNSPDHHREMRLDIDHMSYEELLALGERIGNVGIGLSEETILSHLKTRLYAPSATCTDGEKPVLLDQETDFCVICQSDYKNEEKIGALDCGHEYHVDCIKKWLLVKNACPICKSSAVTAERKDS